MGEQAKCVGCGILSPETESQYTLIGAKHAWRFTRRKVGHDIVGEWRCPKCWRIFKDSGKDLP